MTTEITLDGKATGISPEFSFRDDYSSVVYTIKIQEGEEVETTKIVSVVTSRDHDPDQWMTIGHKVVSEAHIAGYKKLYWS